MRLMVTSGRDAGAVFDFPDYGEISLGRGLSCNVTIDDTQCSRRHARIAYGRENTTIEDLDSTNGIFVNARRHARTMLFEHDTIRIGDTCLTVSGLPLTTGCTTSLRLREQRQSVRVSLPHVEADLSAGEGVPAPPEQIARENAVLRGLCDITRIVAAERDAQRISVAFLDHIKLAIDADTACLLVRDGPEEWRVRATSSDVPDHETITISRTIVEMALEEGVALLCTDLLSDERFDASKSIIRQGISSAVCSPIKTGNEFTGVLFVDRRNGGGMFENIDVRFVATLANVLGVLLEKEKMQLAMRRRQRLATIGEVIAGLAHYAKNVIHGLHLSIATLRLAVRDKRYDALERCLETVTRHEKRIAGLVLDMLNYSKEREVVPEEVDLRAVLREIVEPYRRECEEDGIGLLFEAPEDCPKVRGEETALHRVFLNLVRNAMDAVNEKPEDADRTITVRVASLPAENCTEVSVHDTGTGIPENKRDTIFDVFFSTKGSGGTGLGLAVVSKIVREHGGQIMVDSHEGEWTEFRVRLPVANGRADTVEARKEGG